MDTTRLPEQIVKQATETIEIARNQIPIPGSAPLKTEPLLPEQVIQPTQETQTDDIVLGDESGVVSNFEGLPIENLICEPIIAAARGQQELTNVYIDGLMRLAYGFDGDTPKDKNVNMLTMKMDRPVTLNDGTVTTMPCEVNAPLLALVPVPAFTMDEITVDFSMEVKTSATSEEKKNAQAGSQVGYKSGFGFNASITGNVSSDSMHKRQSDSSATYNIRARAVQQPPSEGMEKLTALMAQMMEPIPAKDESK